MDDTKERRGPWKFKEESLDRIVWGTRFGRWYGPVGRQTTEVMNKLQYPYLSHIFSNFTPNILI